MTDQDRQAPFAPPYQLNTSSVVLNEDAWPMAAPVPPARPPGRRPWVLPLVILLIVAFLGGLIAAGAAEFQAIADRANQVDNGSIIGVPDAPPGSDTIPTEPPTAAAVDCPPTCFTVAHAGLLIPDASLLISLGGNFLIDSTSLQAPVPAAQVYQADAAQWASHRPLPDACFITGSTSPVSPTIGGSDSGSSDPVVSIGSGTDPDGEGTLTQTARFFTDTASAKTYMAATAQQVVTCHLANSGVAPAAKLEVPHSVQLVTFTAHIGATTIYSIDMQRGNVVVRMRLTTPGKISEADFDRFARTWATTNLAQLTVQ